MRTRKYDNVARQLGNGSGPTGHSHRTLALSYVGTGVMDPREFIPRELTLGV